MRQQNLATAADANAQQEKYRRPTKRDIRKPERNDLFELLDDRVGTRATLITGQLPIAKCHTWLEEPTVADAIMDRIVHRAHKIALKGESLR